MNRESAPPPARPASALRALFTVLLLAVLIGLADQASKWAAVSFLPPGESVKVFGNVLRLTLVYNPGLAFGLPDTAGVYLFLLALFLCLAFAVSLFRGRRSGDSEHPSYPKSLAIAVGLGIGGTTGNLIDRLRFGAVVDFLDLGAWPVFNLADIALTVAALLLIPQAFHREKRTPVVESADSERSTDNAQR